MFNDSFVHYFKYFNVLLSEEEWDNTQPAVDFLNAHWLTVSEYQTKWLDIQKYIFGDIGKFIRDDIINLGFKLRVLLAGGALHESGFLGIKNLLEVTECREFALLENWPRFNNQIRLKFSATDSWETLLSGGFVSGYLFGTLEGEYCVYDTSGKWGVYVSNEFDAPICVLIFLPELTDIVLSSFPQNEDDRIAFDMWRFPESFYPRFV